jgi:hypothetical protein
MRANASATRSSGAGGRWVEFESLGEDWVGVIIATSYMLIVILY